MKRRAVSNFFSGSPLDRVDQHRHNASWIESAVAAAESCYVLVVDGDVLVHPEGLRLLARRDEVMHLMPENRSQMTLLGTWENTPVFALVTTEDALGDWQRMDIRLTGSQLSADEASIAAHARALDLWRTRTKFCSVCAAPLAVEKAGHVLRCTSKSCGMEHFPRVDTAVIMLVHDGGDRLLLGRAASWPEGMHSVLAGFLEPGESLEEAVAREVYEEAGVRVRDVQYHSSQPWPFPASLMVGFSSEAKSTALTIDHNELESAAWFTREELLLPREQRPVTLPRRVSISRRLIEDWLANPEDY